MDNNNNNNRNNRPNKTINVNNPFNEENKQSTSSKNTNIIKIGISHGDFNGVGYEILLKTFSDVRVME